jgi:hypothetical protein
MWEERCCESAWCGPDKSAPSCLWIVYLRIRPDATIDRKREYCAEDDGRESGMWSENSCSELLQSSGRAAMFLSTAPVFSRLHSTPSGPQSFSRNFYCVLD